MQGTSRQKFKTAGLTYIGFANKTTFDPIQHVRLSLQNGTGNL